jgi:molybdopterin synthase sulfur carrier subunit
MKVDFYATLRDVTGQKTVDIDLPENATVRQLVDKIVTLYPLLRSKLLDENGDLWGHVHIFINGRDAPFLENALQTVIQPADTVSIFPAVGGGSHPYR